MRKEGEREGRIRVGEGEGRWSQREEGEYLKSGRLKEREWMILIAFFSNEERDESMRRPNKEEGFLLLK